MPHDQEELTGATKAVSAKLFSAAILCRSTSDTSAAEFRRITAAGFPPKGTDEKASTW